MKTISRPEKVYRVIKTDLGYMVDEAGRVYGFFSEEVACRMIKEAAVRERARQLFWLEVLPEGYFIN